MSFISLPPVLYHGTSSLCLSSILYAGLNPIGTFTGRLALSGDINVAVQDAMRKTQQDRLDSGYYQCRSCCVFPIICRIDPALLLNSYLSYPDNDGENHLTRETSRLFYQDVVKIQQTEVFKIPGSY